MSKLLRIREDKGFLGHTHALSSLAIALLLTALFPQFIYDNFLGTTDLLVFISFLFIVVGFSLFPDFDNTQSTVISTLGIVGQAISRTLRQLSMMIFYATRTKYDNPKPSLHREFWHTLVSVFVIGFLVYLTTSLTIKIQLPLLDKTVSLAFLFSLMWLYLSIILSLNGLIKKKAKKWREKSLLSRLLVHLVALSFTLTVLILQQDLQHYTWLVYSAMLGYFIHILGDTLTVSGTPILFPLTHKGKRWWNYRLSKIKAGGTVENYVFIPLFIGIIVLSSLKIILM